MSTEYLVSLIPFGKENAITREELLIKSGAVSDRTMRVSIADAIKKGAFICNDQDGKGYYQASFGDLDIIKKRYKAERKRALSTLAKLKQMRLFLKLYGVDLKEIESEVRQ